MKTQLLLLMVLVSSLYSCTRSRYATTGAYESDDAYYSTSDTYIADFALVDDEAQMAQPSDSASTSSSTDDYYDPTYSAPPVYSPNSSANTWNADPWNSGYNSCDNSFGSNPYWNPYGYNPYNSWYTPYYSPGYYSGWAYNPWYSPYNYSNTGGTDNSAGGGIVYGPRNPISTISATNSSYSSGLFYNGTKRDLHVYVNEIESTQKPVQVSGATLDRPASIKPVNSNSVRPSAQPYTQRPTYTPSKPNRDREVVKPGLTKPREVTPQRDRSPSKPQTGRGNVVPTDTPSRERKPAQQSEPTTRPRSESPVRDTPRTSPRPDSSPSRSSTPTTSPSRSGGGSSNSPRRK